MNRVSGIADFAPDLLLMQERPPPPLPRVLVALVVTLCAAALLWAAFGQLDIVAVAEGKLVPQTYLKIVQPAEGGIVKEILVNEGDAVKTGQVLLKLDPTVVIADGKSVAEEMALRQLTLRRIDAELSGRTLLSTPGDPPVLVKQVQTQAADRAQNHRDTLAQEVAQRNRLDSELKAAAESLSKLRATVPIYEHAAASYRGLVAEGYAPALVGADKDREAIEKAQDLRSAIATTESLRQAVAAQDKRIAAVTSSYRSQLANERTEALGQTAKLQQDLRKADFRQGLTELRAPQDGIVKDLAISTPGAVVQPGMVLLTLVPQGEEMVAEVQVRNEDIGFVQAGQGVKVKVAAYPFQKFGLMEGRVASVAPDSQSSTGTGKAFEGYAADSGRPPSGYKAIVRIDAQRLLAQTSVGRREYPLEAGMVVVAEIHQGKRTVMEYLLSPIQRVAQEAGRER